MGERPPHVSVARHCLWGGRCIESHGKGETINQGNKKCCKEVLEDCSICSPATGIQVASNPWDTLARYRNKSNFTVRRQSHGTAMITVKVGEGAEELLKADKAIGDLCRDDDWKITIQENGSVVGEIGCKCQDDKDTLGKVENWWRCHVTC